MRTEKAYTTGRDRCIQVRIVLVAFQVGRFIFVYDAIVEVRVSACVAHRDKVVPRFEIFYQLHILTALDFHGHGKHVKADVTLERFERVADIRSESISLV